MQSLADSTYSLCRDLIGLNGSASCYTATYLCFASFPLIGLPILLVFDAPWGRFSWNNDFLSFNANVGWWIMEIVSPVTFAMSLLSPALSSHQVLQPWLVISQARDRVAALSTPTKLLATVFLIHYANRSTISTLRTPAKRSPMHVMPFLFAVTYNLCNGSLIGGWLGGRTLPVASAGAVPEQAMSTSLFWAGISMWAIGFAGNIYHDDILHKLRRPGKDGKARPRYSVPHGALYDWPLGGISFPNYFCEWCEWIGFALACSSIAPPPALPLSSASLMTTSIAGRYFKPIASIFQRMLSQHGSSPLLKASTYLTPPWIFVYSEICVMAPRAIRGHIWYQRKFGKDMPAQRKAVIPGVI